MGEFSEVELKIKEIIDQGKFIEEFKKIKDGNKKDLDLTNLYTILYHIAGAIRNSEYKKRFDGEEHEKKIIQFNRDVAEITKPYDEAMAYIRNHKNL